MGGVRLGEGLGRGCGLLLSKQNISFRANMSFYLHWHFIFMANACHSCLLVLEISGQTLSAYLPSACGISSHIPMHGVISHHVNLEFHFTWCRTLRVFGMTS